MQSGAAGCPRVLDVDGAGNQGEFWGLGVSMGLGQVGVERADSGKGARRGSGEDRGMVGPWMRERGSPASMAAVNRPLGEACLAGPPGPRALGCTLLDGGWPRARRGRGRSWGSLA